MGIDADAVRRDTQGQGHGTALLKYVEAELRISGQRLLLVETSGSPNFERTRAFYAKCGYEAEARIRDYYDVGEDMVIFRKALSSDNDGGQTDERNEVMNITTPNQQLPVNWEAVADRFCEAWTSSIGKPNFDTLGEMYARDEDVIIYDTLPPLNGFRGFDDLRTSIYEGLASMTTELRGNVTVRALANGEVIVTSYPFHLSYRFDDGRHYEIDARITEVWEKRGERYVIVHEHPSTIYDPPK